MFRAIAAVALVPASLVVLTASGLAQMTQRDAPESEGRRICRIQGETGKLAARRRVCLTKAEWDRTAEEQRKTSRYILDTLDSCQNRAENGPCG
ncbi:MAG: hypothetical protein AB7O91_07360 [Sphingomonas sp.]